MAHKTKLTKLLMGKFLKVVSNNGGIVVDAAEDLHISRMALYGKRNRDEAFRKKWDEAVGWGIDVIEDEAKRRALLGTEEPVFYEGEIVATVRKKSDYCLGLVLKAHKPNYKEKHEITGPNDGPLISKVIVYLPDNQRSKSNSLKEKVG